MIVPLFVGREKSVRALEEVMNEEKQILLLTQKNAAEDDPTTGRPAHHRHAGDRAAAAEAARPDRPRAGRRQERAPASPASSPRSDFFQANDRARFPRSAASAKETEALIRTVKTNFEQYIKLNKKVPAETLAVGRADRRSGQAGRHGRLASVGQDRRPPGACSKRSTRPSGWRRSSP